jgi:omega-6 fatty acid desaturase (delta-12 desaturase)
VAAWQVVNTLVPYALLWWLAVYCLRQGSWLVLPVLGLMVLFLARCFSLMHDCGHHSLFRKSTTNRWVGFLFGIVAGIPQLPWSKGHAFHHRHNGNWERYKGPSALVSVDTYSNFSNRGKAFYRLLRHPLMLIPGGFFYLVIKPRLELLAGLTGLVPHLLTNLGQSSVQSWPQIVASHKSRWWHSPEEFRDLLLNNLAVLARWIGLSCRLGAGTIMLIYAPVMA